MCAPSSARKRLWTAAAPAGMRYAVIGRLPERLVVILQEVPRSGSRVIIVIRKESGAGGGAARAGRRGSVHQPSVPWVRGAGGASLATDAQPRGGSAKPSSCSGNCRKYRGVSTRPQVSQRPAVKCVVRQRHGLLSIGGLVYRTFVCGPGQRGGLLAQRGRRRRPCRRRIQQECSRLSHELGHQCGQRDHDRDQREADGHP